MPVIVTMADILLARRGSTLSSGRASWEAELSGAPEDSDAIIVGAGQAGPPMVARLAGAGMNVAIV